MFSGGLSDQRGKGWAVRLHIGQPVQSRCMQQDDWAMRLMQFRQPVRSGCLPVRRLQVYPRQPVLSGNLLLERHLQLQRVLKLRL